MHLVIGLGNPGNQYKYTRHNAGFLALEVMTAKFGFDPPANFKSSLASKGRLEGEQVVLAWPQTYMNLSGQAVQELAGFYKVPGENILVVHDEMDLEPGRIKLAFGGGTAGHKGLSSILAILKQDFCRLKIGIGRPPKEIFTAGNADYVLARFLEMEAPAVEKSFEEAAEVARIWLLEGLAKAQLKANRRPKTKKPKNNEAEGEPEPKAAPETA